MAGNPFSMNEKEKDLYMTEQLLQLTEYHRERCESYRRMLTALRYEASAVTHYRELPFLPVTLFKKMTLSSLPEEADHYRVVTSSGTGGQAVSRIVLDAETSTRQQQALAEIGSNFLGTKRMPMLVIDCPAAMGSGNPPAVSGAADSDSLFSARRAGIQGFSLFGRRRVFALHDDMTLNEEAVRGFLEKYGQAPFLIFGFTYMVWQYFCLEQERRGISFDCSNGTLVHGGGWKKLADQAVSRQEGSLF